MRLRPILFSTALLLAGCSGSSGGDGSSTPTALVTLATAQDGNVASAQTVYGMVEQNADTQYILSAPVEAVVSRIAAPVGTAVGSGQLVVVLSPSPSTRAQIAQLSAAANSARQAYERAQRLRKDGLVSDAEVESARTAAEGAKANLAALDTQTGQLALRSPGPGFVQAIASRPGELVAAGTTVATISRNGALRAQFGIDPALLPQLSRGAGLRISSLEDGNAVVLPIRSVDPSADPQTHLASIYVTVPASYRSGVGQPLKGAVTLEQARSAVVVPYAALLNDGGQPYVFVVTGGVAHRKDVSIGASDGKTVAIASGVKVGDKIVTAGGTALEDGMKVRTR